MTEERQPRFRDLPQSTVGYRVAGNTYPLKVVKGCKICRTHLRVLIENALLEGRSYEAIASVLPKKYNLTGQNIGDHYRNGHLPMEESARREIIERTAKELNLSSMTDEGLVDHKTLLKLVVQDTFTRIAKRELEPDITDGLRAARLLEQMTIDEDDRQAQGDFTRTIRAVMESAKKTMTQEQFQVFSQNIIQDPAMRELMGRPVITVIPEEDSSPQAQEAQEVPLE